jgi:hypothetical protein
VGYLSVQVTLLDAKGIAFTSCKAGDIFVDMT